MISKEAKDSHELCGALADWFDSQGASPEEALVVMTVYSGMIIGRCYDPTDGEKVIDKIVATYGATIKQIASGIREEGV